MGGLATGAGLIGRLFGPDVTGVMARLDGATPDPTPVQAEEARYIANAVPRRRHEFLIGRDCAHAALAAIGRDDGAIAVGARRQPLWPTGVVGSIAHGGDWAGAVVAPAEQARGLGLDIEPLEPPLPPEVADLVLIDAERRRLPAHPPQARLQAKVTYTAKECVFKALYPSTGWFLEHSDVEIDLDLATGRWNATLGEGFPQDGPPLSGRFEVVGGHLFTAVLVALNDAIA